MKKTRDRVFAYQLATEVDKKDLAEIAGGSAQGFCTKITRSWSGTEHSWDVSFEVVVDW